MGFSLILRAFFSFPNERQFIECQFFWEFREWAFEGALKEGRFPPVSKPENELRYQREHIDRLYA